MLQDFNNSIDFREYLLGVLAISRVSNASEMLQLAFERRKRDDVMVKDPLDQDCYPTPFFPHPPLGHSDDR
uniref:(California timema) hypothetical protein n=1 Tax=Timema californicum TaxID=61474 RepID=A0A7R9JEN6_TIMCA|nr:unnamed protein product [Timema californicum]